MSNAVHSTVPRMHSGGNPNISKYYVVSEDHKFDNPAKLIRNINDMKMWEKSESYLEYLGFVLAINEAVKGKSNSQGSQNLSSAITNLVELLNVLDKYIDEFPPIQQPQRFGNKAYKSWYQQLKTEGVALLQKAIPPNLHRSIPEIVIYLIDGFGNPTRIDYGTGHELSFVMFLCCLYKIGFLMEDDRVATGCLIFPRYLEVARKLQQVYRMEPAGSHGVWSLDDFQFIPFIWGSAQLIAHPKIEPPSFLNNEILKEYGKDYMFLSCIQYINSVKTGPFAEHSNQLWSISGVSTWSKINMGLIKMYKAEVLGKFPVVQHIVFGSLFTLKPAETTPGFTYSKMSTVDPPKALHYQREQLLRKVASEEKSRSSGSSVSEEGSSKSGSEESKTSDVQSGPSEEGSSAKSEPTVMDEHPPIESIVSTESPAASVQDETQSQRSVTISIKEHDTSTKSATPSVKSGVPGSLKSLPSSLKHESSSLKGEGAVPKVEVSSLKGETASVKGETASVKGDNKSVQGE